MKKTAAPRVDATVWIAISAQGHPAPFIGYAYQRKFLVLTYQRTFGHTLKHGGYRTVKVRLTTA